MEVQTADPLPAYSPLPFLPFQAMVYLYKHSFNEIELRPLGHVHTGNVYLDNDGNCRLGGHENKLLGYRTRLHSDILDSNCIGDVDVVLFG